MAISGFEGFEKRLELQFFCHDNDQTMLGLRQLAFESLEQVLFAVQCTVVSAVGNSFFDAYVLSESSLFVYPNKIIIKTCGTTQLLKSIPLLIHFAANLGLTLCYCRYTRGDFIFPESQPFPHTSFNEEIIYIERNIPMNLCYKKASVMNTWHVFTASLLQPSESNDVDNNVTTFTVEVCMTELNRQMARKFFTHDGKTGDVGGKHMTEVTGIDDVNPKAFICDFAFDPCGYSMNGVDGDRYSTIHVTPEDGFSYASFECIGSVYDDPDDVVETLKKAVRVFMPATVSVALTNGNDEVCTRLARAFKPFGLECRSFTMDEFPSTGTVVYQTFTSARRKMKAKKIQLE